MSEAEQLNADQLSFWNGVGGNTWVERQAYTDIILTPVMDALLKSAAPNPGEQVLDVGCGCGAATLDFARAVTPSGRVVGLDISEAMLAEGNARALAAGISNVDWRREDAATANLERFDLLASAFGVMFFGDPVGAFAHMRRSAKPGARMALLCWRPLSENPWMEVPMNAVLPHLPPRPKGNPQAPGMFAFSDPERVTGILTEAGWAAPRFEQVSAILDIAAGRGLEEAVVQTTKIGAINSWLRNESAETIKVAVSSIREVLADYSDGGSVRLPGSAWLIGSTAD